MKGWKYSDRHPGGDARRRTNGERMRVRQGIKALVATVFTGGLVASALAVAPAAAGAASTEQRAGGDVELHHGRDDLDPDRHARLELQLPDLRREGVLPVHQRPGRRERPQDRLQVRAGRRRQPDHVQPAGQHADQPGPRVRGDRRGHRLLLAQPLHRVGHPDLRLQRDRATGPAAPNLFAAGGSVQYYPAEGPIVGYVSKQTKSPKIAFVAYGVAASADACQAGASALSSNGFQVVYTDFKVSLPGHHGGHRRAAHEAGRRQHDRQLHGRAGEHHHGPGRAAVRPQGHAALVQRQRPGDAAAEHEPDAGRLLQHRPRALHGADVDLPGPEACT